MATTPLNTLKSWFETGDYPTQAQFWSWLESFWHKDDPIPMSAIAGLANLLAGKATVQDIQNLQQLIQETINNASAATVRLETATDLDYTLPAGELFEKVVLIPTNDITISMGTTPGGMEITPDLTCVAGKPSVFPIDWYGAEETHIHITGITVQTQVIIYKRK